MRRGPPVFMGWFLTGYGHLSEGHIGTAVAWHVFAGGMFRAKCQRGGEDLWQLSGEIMGIHGVVIA